MSDAADSVHRGQRLFKPYAKHKDSGVDWLGEIPAHWDVERLKYLATLNDDVLPESTDPAFEMAYVDISSVDATAGITETEALVFHKAPSRARRVVQDGDVIVSTVRTYLRAIAALETPPPNLIVSTGFAVVRPRRLDSAFASYALCAPHFVERVVANSVGVSYPAINASDLACFPIPYPAVAEQRAIADFLDRETAKIDALVAKKERLIELLQEKRTALITRAVTRGLDPNVPMKDSGVEWLGQIPAHWEGRPLRVELIRNDGGVWGDDFDEDGTLVLRSTEQTVEGGWRIDQPARRRLGSHEAMRTRLDVGDLLVTKSSGSIHHIGKTSIVDEAIADLHCCFSNFMQRLRVGEKHTPRFFWYFMNSPAARQQFVYLSSTTTGLGNLNGTILGAVRIPIPPTEEQDEIARFLDRDAHAIATLVAKVRQAIDHLREFRTALISAAVTGKIDVREASSR